MMKLMKDEVLCLCACTWLDHQEEQTGHVNPNLLVDLGNAYGQLGHLGSLAWQILGRVAGPTLLLLGLAKELVTLEASKKICCRKLWRSCAMMGTQKAWPPGLDFATLFMLRCGNFLSFSLQYL